MIQGNDMQKLIDSKWVEFDGVLIDGDHYRIPIGGTVVDGVLVGNGWDGGIYVTPSSASIAKKIVGMGDIGELLPDEVLVELIDYSNDKTANQAIRNGATRVITRINSNQNVDVLEPAFINLLQSLVSFTSLTLKQATEIFNKLKN